MNSNTHSGGYPTRRLDRLRRVLGHLRVVADPAGDRDRAERRHSRRGLWLSPTWEGMVAVNGLLEPEAGQIVLAALEPLPAPATLRTPALVGSVPPMR